jgi:hypothetical protein
LTFGDKFNQLVNLPSNITYLTFGWSFNQPVNLPSNIINLTFGFCFNQKINIPTSIKYLKLYGNNKQYIVDNLPNGIEELEFNIKNLELSNLPTGIKKILVEYGGSYNGELNCLPKSIEHIRLNKYYENKISNIPDNLKILECSLDYKFISDFIDKYQIIELKN